MRKSRRFAQLDVFADRPGAGNPLAVVLDSDGIDSESMQAFAAWTNLVETTFLLPPEAAGADYRVRIFTPEREIAFAGHPSIGSAHAALESGLVRPRGGQVVQECKAGLVTIRIEDHQLFFEAPRANVVREAGPDEGIVQDAIAGATHGGLPIALVEGGRRWWVAELARESDVRSWYPDHAAIAELAQSTASLGVCVFARSVGEPYDIVVRAFPAGVGIVEDPASGAANGLIAAYIGAREPDGPLARGYRVSQGREMGHDATIVIRMDGTGPVWVGGQTHSILAGTVEWDTTT